MSIYEKEQDIKQETTDLENENILDDILHLHQEYWRQLKSKLIVYYRLEFSQIR